MPNRPTLTAQWKNLVIANFAVDPGLLEPLVPSGTRLDPWGDVALVSLVAFQFLDTRVYGIPIPLHRNFDEVNLRFYVRRDVGAESRRGVVFIKEIVPRWAIATTARLLYGEKYVALPMRHEVLPADVPASAEYSWRHRGAWNRLRVVPAGEPAFAVAGSEEEFITEHYWGYSKLRGGGTVEYRVEHPRWRVWSAAESLLECDAAALYGAALAGPLAARPTSAFLADGSPVIVYKGERIA
jgi:uncharacterized protein YqjF (DUF2071 family)